jgi:hypothetical protein
VQKDAYNTYNVARWAEDHQKRLEKFYSIDTPSGVRFQSGDRGLSSSASGKMNPHLQRLLWSQIPSTSDQAPGMLELCQGMPVLIRNNDATDLCITKGQESEVVAWTAHHIPGFPGYKCLETLFVRLVNAPRDVQVPHLPLNVVPLCRQPSSLEAKVPSGHKYKITRRQIPILPNFAMTDYSSQGKTRAVNVVDLTMCKSSQAIYTCLSRGKTAADTLILRDFPTTHMTGGIYGWLRQEFRELNVLDRITELRYDEQLPEGILQPTRWSTIDSYKQYGPHADDHHDWHPILRPEPTASEFQRPKRVSTYRPNMHNMLRKAPPKDDSKRKRSDSTSLDTPNKKNKTATDVSSEGRVSASQLAGPRWDRQDHSCAFDSWLFIIYATWVHNDFGFQDDVLDLSPWLRMLKDHFTHHLAPALDDRGLSSIRDEWRRSMRDLYPADYIAGTNGVDICALTYRLFGRDAADAETEGSCRRCGAREMVSGYTGIGPVILISDAVQSVQEEVSHRMRCYDRCRDCGGEKFYQHLQKSVLCVQVVPRINVSIDVALEAANGVTYRLAGIIYFGDRHFVSRTVSPVGDVYFHDGMEGPSCIWEANLHASSSHAWLQMSDGKRASMALYTSLSYPMG